MLLNGKVAIITGGGRGIGEATALRFAGEGAIVALVSRTRADLEAVSRKVQEAGGRAFVAVADVASEDQVQDVVRTVISELGRVDILVNSAGTAGEMIDLVDLPVADWDQIIATNLRGTMLCCKYALIPMIEARAGSIVNLSSNNGRRGTAGRSHYAASKWAVHGLTHTLAWEAGKHNIRVNCVVAGATRTEELDRSLRARAGYEGRPYEDVVAAIARQSPMERILDPPDVAEAILYLASDEAIAMTGQTVNVNAGSWMT